MIILRNLMRAPLALALGAAVHVAGAQRTRHAATTICMSRSGELSDLKLGGTRVTYVEPESFVAAGTRALLVGTPTYVWAQTGGEMQEGSGPVGFGAILEAGRPPRLVRAPVDPTHIVGVRAAPDGGKWWIVAFAEATVAPKPSEAPPVVAYWLGRTDGVQWTTLARIPLRGMTVRPTDASRLVVDGSMTAVAMPMRDSARWNVLVIRRARAEWRVDTVRASGAAYVALASGGRGSLLLGVVHADLTRRVDENSLFLHAFDPATEAWRSLGLLVQGGADPVHGPLLSVTGSDTLVAWVSRSPGHGSVGHVRLASAGHAPVVLDVPGQLDQFTFAGWWQSAPVWVASSPPNALGASDLRVFRLSGDTLAVVRQIANPIQGPFAAVIRQGTLLISGPVARQSPREPVVRSRILALRLSCR